MSNQNLINILCDKNLIPSKKFIKYFKNKKILILGSSGLIGISILFGLFKLDSNLKITCTYNNFIFKFILDFFKKNKNISFIKIDLSKNINKLKEEYDLIYFCAGYGQPAKFLNNKLTTYILHSSTLISLKKNIKKNGKLIFMSSSEIYSGNEGKCNESSIGYTNTNHPRSSYIESKKFAESLIINSYPNYLIFRVSLLYGPGAKLNDERFLNEVIIKSLKNDMIIARNKSNQTRSNLFVDDALNLIFISTALLSNEILNLSGNSETTIHKMLNLISNISNKKIKYLSKNDYSAPKNIKIVNHKIKRICNYYKFNSLRKGIEKTMKWYDNLLMTQSKKFR